MVIDNHKLTPVLIGIHLVALPMYTRLPFYVLLLIVAFTLWSLLIIAGRSKQPGSFLRILLSLAVLASLLVSYGTIFGQEPGTAMLLMLSFLKLFEMKGRRDVLLVIFLGYFLIAMNFFHTQSPWIALYVFVVVIYLTSLLIIFSDRLSSTSFKTRIKISLRMVMQAIPLMLVLFFLFPRIPGPLWSLPDDTESATTGVGDEMSPGSINSLISSGAVAFRVQFKSEPPEKKDLYWRGLVLSHYDGEKWTREDAPTEARPRVVYEAENSDMIEYSVMMEPHGRKWLYSLETLVAKKGSYKVSRELQVLAEEAVKTVLFYKMSSSLAVSNRGLYKTEREKNLLLPKNLNPKTIELAKQLRSTAGNNTAALVKAVLAYFRAQSFSYTLSPALLGDNAMDDFIFNTREGFCEHFSSAFVYLMRAAGVPARVVVGYQGGEINPLDDYMIVRQSDAHAWAEVWLDDKGWVRVDPTSMASPDRIENGIANAGLEASRLPSALVSNNNFLIQLRYTVDSFNHSWNKWVVGFDDEKQKDLLGSLGLKDIDKATLFSWMVLAMTLFGALVALWVFKSGAAKSRKDLAVYYYDMFCKKMAKKGLVKKSSESASEFLVKSVRKFPETRRDVETITQHYYQIRYGGDDSQSRKKQLRQAVKMFFVK